MKAAVGRDGTMQMPERNLYDVLGVGRDADTATIKRAFRSQARTLHPDVSEDPEAADRFSELSQAYDVLSKPTARILYDRIGYRGRGNGDFTPSGDGETPRLELAEVEVAAFEAARGTRRKVRVTAAGPCTACGGTGAEPRTLVSVCPNCGGDGRIRRRTAAREARLLQIETCGACAGRGRTLAHPCVACDGSGTARGDRTLALEVPPGATDGSLLRAAREGEGGEVYVLLRVLPERDARLVRYASAAALLLALALFVVIALAPESLSL
jgi:molecular chaperone DnaJ